MSPFPHLGFVIQILKIKCPFHGKVIFCGRRRKTVYIRIQFVNDIVDLSYFMILVKLTAHPPIPLSFFIVTPTVGERMTLPSGVGLMDDTKEGRCQKSF